MARDCEFAKGVYKMLLFSDFPNEEGVVLNKLFIQCAEAGYILCTSQIQAITPIKADSGIAIYFR